MQKPDAEMQAGRPKGRASQSSGQTNQLWTPTHRYSKGWRHWAEGASWSEQEPAGCGGGQTHSWVIFRLSFARLGWQIKCPASAWKSAGHPSTAPAVIPDPIYSFDPSLPSVVCQLGRWSLQVFISKSVWMKPVYGFCPTEHGNIFMGFKCFVNISK